MRASIVPVAQRGEHLQEWHSGKQAGRNRGCGDDEQRDRRDDEEDVRQEVDRVVDDAARVRREDAQRRGDQRRERT